MAGKDFVSLTDLQKDAITLGVNNAAGGAYNHALFFDTMCPAGSGGKPSPALAAAIDKAFGSFEAFQEKFSATALGHFGSGWGWLGVLPNGDLAITSSPNQDNPAMDGGWAKMDHFIPFLGVDMWEHAFYLKHQNVKANYVKDWWNVVDWNKVSKYYEEYASKGKVVPAPGY